MQIAEHLTPLRAWRKQVLPSLGETPTCSVPAVQAGDASVYGLTSPDGHV